MLRRCRRLRKTKVTSCCATAVGNAGRARHKRESAPNPDVLGRGDFLAVLDAAVEAWTKHKQLLAVYDRQKKWSWKQGSINQGEEKLEKETLQLKAKLSVVCSLTVDATTTLTVTGMRTALEKSSQLVELTALLVRFKKEVEEQARLLHRRISQLTHQQPPTASKFFWTALNPP